MLVNKPLAMSLFAGLALTLTACAGNLGETRIEGKFEPPKQRLQLGIDAAEAGLSNETIQSLMRPSPTRLTLIDGKDKKSVAWKLDTSKGVAEYNASDVSATSPAEQRAEISEDAGDTATEALGQVPFPEFLELLAP